LIQQIEDQVYCLNVSTPWNQNLLVERPYYQNETSKLTVLYQAFLNR